MTKYIAELLTEPTNYAVVKLPGRAFPGVVFQGDSLNSLITNLDALVTLAQSCREASLLEELTIVRDDLHEIRSRYEKTCAANAISLPYPKTD
jgi:predicted RNase H-like HicB family nuclease